MTPEEFVAKWTESTRAERAAAQEWFVDLCNLLDEPTPNDADPTGNWYAFEKGTKKAGSGHGWADAWKRGHFGWEFKGKGAPLGPALRQLQLYALALESPPLLIVSNIDRIEIHTAFQNAVQDTHVIQLRDLLEADSRRILKWAFSEPDRLRPTRTKTQLTEEAAGQFATLAEELRQAGHDSQKVAHFLNKLVFCMFAEDAGLLPDNLFTRLMENAVQHPKEADKKLQRLFEVMQHGGNFGLDNVDWFNGGLYDGPETLPLTGSQVRLLHELSQMDWDQLEPSIFGTLYERGLDPAKRSQLGAHFTDPGSIMRLVNPTIVEPLLSEWNEVKKEIGNHINREARLKSPSAKKKAHRAADNAFKGFLERLRNFKVLDPACGSGNFLYLSLRALKDIEHQVNLEAEEMGLLKQNPMVGPENVLGIEISAFAAETARVTIWIGEIQWMLNHGYQLNRKPILRNLTNVEQRDAILDDQFDEPEWPEADVIVGNPPFLGNKKMLRELGEDYTQKLRGLYEGRVGGGADLVTYWYEKARKQLRNGLVSKVGLVATNTIRSGQNRGVLSAIQRQGRIFHAWSDLPWINEGAAVRVSLICFDSKQASDQRCWLDGKEVDEILDDLTAVEKDSGRTVDVTRAIKLYENKGIAFQGPVKVGPFDISEEVASKWLAQPNPHGKSNLDVLRPWINGLDITRRPSRKWIIDFGAEMSEQEASLYEAPFSYVEEFVKPMRLAGRRAVRKKYWWRHGETVPALRSAIGSLSRYICTPRVAKHRIFVWVDERVLPDSRVYAIARQDDVTFGILHSRFHEVWSLATCSWHGGERPTYNAQSVFEPYPFPDGLSPDIKESNFCNAATGAIETAAKNLVGLRDKWLNPPEWVDRVQAIAPGYPDRLIPKGQFAKDLKKRTLTNLYNARPAWLVNAHRELDEAVAAAYGWPADLSDDEILNKLLALNRERAQSEKLV